MPPARVSTIQDPHHRSERRTTSRAASVPVGQRENSRLESLRSRRQKSLLPDVDDIPPPSLPNVVIIRRRKRDSSSCAVPQVDCIPSTSASVVERTADASEQRPRKRCKRSSSTPAAPTPTQPQSRRRSRSRAGSPTTDVENVPRSRVARLSRKIHSFIDSRNSDIYTHLADPGGAGNLLSGPPTGSVVLSTPNEVIGSQSIKRGRGRRRNTVDLTDENTKKDLMEEWARMRQSQGALPPLGINERACFSQTLLHDSRKGDVSVSSVQLEAITRGNSLDLSKSQTAITNNLQSQGTILDVSLGGSSSTRLDIENSLSVRTDTPGKKLDHKDSVPPDDGTEQPVVSSVGNETPSTSIPDTHMDEESPSDELADVPETTYHLDLVQCPGSNPPPLSAPPPRKDSVHIRHTESTKLSINEQAEAASSNSPPKESRSVTFPQTYPTATGNIHLDSDEEFYMLDIPEIFTLPWVPVSSHLYVPCGLGKLVSGMKEQLVMEARARRRAEELYQGELRRRISAEKIIEDLRTKLKEGQ